MKVEIDGDPLRQEGRGGREREREVVEFERV